MRRTFIALAAAATIGVPTLYSGGAQAQPGQQQARHQPAQALMGSG